MNRITKEQAKKLGLEPRNQSRIFQVGNDLRWYTYEDESCEYFVGPYETQREARVRYDQICANIGNDVVDYEPW